MFRNNNNTTVPNHTGRDTALGAGAGGVLGHEGHHGHTGRDAAVGGFAGHELGHHGNGTAPGTHGNRDGLIGAGTGAAVGHGGGHGMRDAAIGGVGGEMLGRHQGKNAYNAPAYNAPAYDAPVAGAGVPSVVPAAAGAGMGAGAGAGAGVNTGNPSRTHGKMTEIEGKVERGLGNIAGSTSLGIKGENKIIAGQREQAAVGGHRQADMLETQAATHRNQANAMHPSI
ncbi:hypothetical protein BDP27DRAFT_1361351 [Rhodocollybia butyracea]|uniref:Uncharacterized protein n=1 Tax=Rhodocollybia butyracea TaxID=206335 RepID=A0A9P5UAK0_9AGAR|nr:hypothetical protein BDP27DRAFT_1361351 [Rhodocollybia butyracea]